MNPSGHSMVPVPASGVMCSTPHQSRICRHARSTAHHDDVILQIPTHIVSERPLHIYSVGVPDVCIMRYLDFIREVSMSDVPVTTMALFFPFSPCSLPFALVLLLQEAVTSCFNHQIGSTQSLHAGNRCQILLWRRNRSSSSTDSRVDPPQSISVPGNVWARGLHRAPIRVPPCVR